MARRGACFVDCFTSLDDIKGKARSNLAIVLSTIMKNGGRFSAFDASDDRMARSLTAIAQSGWTRDKRDPGYPWVEWELTDAGRAQMAAWSSTTATE
jgi:hypothetical protein